MSLNHLFVLVVALIAVLVSIAHAEVISEGSTSMFWDWCTQPRMPKLIDLNLRRSGSVHFANSFLFALDPKVSNFTKQQQYLNINTGKEDSLLRIAVAPTQHFDVGVFLHLQKDIIEKGANDAKPISLSRYSKDEEVITAKLSSNEKYVLTFYSSGFVNWTQVKNMIIAQQNEDNSNFWCPTVQIELAIAPVRIAQKSLDAINAKCPSTPEFPDIKFTEMQIDNSLKAFGFDGRAKTFFAPNEEKKNQIKIEKMYQFTVPTVAPLWWLDVAVNYDFLTNGAFGLFLVQTFNQPQDITDVQYVAKCIADDSCTPAVRRHINTLILSEPLKPGYNYSLLLYNDYTKHSEIVSKCVPFSMNITLLPVIKSINNITDMLSCDMTEPFPATLNGVGFLSDISLHRLHLTRKVYANKHHTRDMAEFTILEDSLFRVHAQRHHRIGVEIKIHKGKLGTVIDRVSSSDPDSGDLLTELTPGDYLLELSYFAIGNKKLPMPQECVAVGIQIAAEPISFIKNEDAHTSTCDSIELPSMLNGDSSSHFYRAYNTRSLSSALSQEMKFKVSVESLLLIRISNDFLTGSLNMKVHGDVTLVLGNSKTMKQKSAKKTYRSSIYDDTVIVNHIIPRGSYTVSFSDFTKYPSWLRCSKFLELEVTLFTRDYLRNITRGAAVSNETSATSGNKQQEVSELILPNCPLLRKLPDSLFTNDSIEFGGPQKENGEILFRAKHVYVSLNQQFRSLYFSVSEPSIIRAFLISHQKVPMHLAMAKPGADLLDVVPGKQFLNKYVTFADNMLAPDTRYPYQLLIAHKATLDKKANETCPPDYSLQVQIVTVPNYRKTFECSKDKETSKLPASVQIKERDYHLVNDRFFITGKDFLKSLNVSHRMTIEIPNDGSYFLSALIQYNFLAADFQLLLSGNGVLEAGESHIDLNRGSEFRYNFRNKVQVKNLKKGTYNLDLIDHNQKSVHNIKDSDCIHFYFSLEVEQIELQSNPKETTVPNGKYTPRVLSIDPYDQHIVKSNSLLVINIEFSEIVGHPAADSANLLESIIDNEAVYLKDVSSQLADLETRNDIQPLIAQFKTKHREILQVLFALHDSDIHMGETRFTLQLKAEFFKTQSNVTFSLPDFMKQTPPTFVVQLEKKKDVAEPSRKELDAETEELRREQEERDKERQASEEIERAVEENQKKEEEAKTQQAKADINTPAQQQQQQAEDQKISTPTAGAAGNKCQPNSCGCAYNPSNPSVCEKQLGHCDDTRGFIVCTCYTGYTGQYCTQCAPGYFNYPNCQKEVSCPNSCSNRGTCNAGKCICRDNFAGDACDKCIAGFQGPNCTEATLSSWDALFFFLRIFVIIGALIGIVAVVVFAYLRFRATVAKKSKGGKSKSKSEKNQEASGNEEEDDENVYVFDSPPDTLDVVIEDDEDIAQKDENAAAKLENSIGNDKL